MNDAWTPTAEDCYNRGCVCEGCFMFKILHNTCQMKSAVIDLVRKFGRPPEKPKEFLPGINNNLQKTVDAILNGATDKQTLAKILNKPGHQVQNNINKLCNIVQAQGYKFTKRVGRLPELVEILNEESSKFPIEVDKMTKIEKIMCLADNGFTVQLESGTNGGYVTFDVDNSDWERFFM